MKSVNMMLSHLISFGALGCFLFAPAVLEASTKHTVSDFSSMPVNIVEAGAKPRVVINASNDHQLFFKAYNDYTDLDGDGIVETTYKNSIDYYGYFDSYKCYTYNESASTQVLDDKGNASVQTGRFEPKSFTKDKYCGAANGPSKGEWSGNFLNWVAMSRIDTIRKILFGGHRRVDSATATVLERSYLPQDAHSWAKHYSGADLSKLTPFSRAGADGVTAGGSAFFCDEGNMLDAQGKANVLCADPDDDPLYFPCPPSSTDHRCKDASDAYNYNCADHTDPASDGYQACKDVQPEDPRYKRNRRDYDAALDYRDDDWDGTPVAMKKVGITLGNTTDVNPANYKTPSSELVTDPPLLKAVAGNYSLWGANEGRQLAWASGSPVYNLATSNGNNPKVSQIAAYSTSPDWSKRLGFGNYTVRVQACVPGLTEDLEIAQLTGSKLENCKRYPGPDGIGGNADDTYKPIGLLQSYGDDDRMYFGLVGGTYQKHASGGDVIRNVQSFRDEVNVSTDGSFPLVAQFAGGPMSNMHSGGLVNAWSLYRIVRYDVKNGYYNSYDDCPWLLSKQADVTSTKRCHNWGNPFAEIYAQSINYLAGEEVIGEYRSTGSSGIPGLPVPQNFVDPLDEESYCAQLSVINFNSSVISYDYDNLDGNKNFNPQVIWDPATLPGDRTTVAMTDEVGRGEGLHGSKFFIGEADLGSDTDDQLCTEKTLDSLGTAGGLCPEAPRLLGSYRIAGLAYYAHVNDIRPPKFNNRKISGEQVVDTYSVALATGAPLIEVPDPDPDVNNVSGKSSVTILPACRNTGMNPQGNCAIVDFKIISQEIDKTAKTVKGRTYVNWEDSEQGGDYDQDMWGVLEYEYNKNTNKLTITTQVFNQSASPAMAFGYVLSGTTNNGFHAHSGINGYKNTDKADIGSDCTDYNGCNCRTKAGEHGACNAVDSLPSVKIYTVAASTAKQLEDPLWYAAKWGGFIDSNDNKLPDKTEEWDSMNNATGESGSDGIPDNYYYASNPQQLEDSLYRVFNAILERTSSGTAAAVVSSNVSGEGALYQAYYEPLKKDGNIEARWLGTVQALWLDSAGRSRQDCSPPADSLGFDVLTGKCLPPPQNLSGGVCVPNGRLDNYCVDQVVLTYYDDFEKRTRTRVFDSDHPDEFTPYALEGVVSSFNANTGEVIMVPNAMEGMVTYTAGTPDTLTLAPYSLSATVTAYDPVTGKATITVNSIEGPSGVTGNEWAVSTSAGIATGLSVDTLTFTGGSTQQMTVVPAGDWLVNWTTPPVYDADGVLTTAGEITPTTITLKTKRRVGANGKVFRNWYVQCLEGGSGEGMISGIDMQLNNNSTETGLTITSAEGEELTGCTRARFSTYNMQGDEGEIFSSWRVSNQETAGTGVSESPMTLGNYGDRTFTVAPALPWLSPGDSVLVSNYSFTTKELYDIGYLWNAREQLYLPAVSLDTNRSWTTAASSGRFIQTWVDLNLNGKIDAGEYRPFVKEMLGNGVSHRSFDVSDTTEAGTVIDYVRGKELPGTRNRTIRYSENAAGQNVMRLGDIVNSTPAVVAAPQEGIDLLYQDGSYREFRRQYLERRSVIYVGGNDGLLHAFNGGFYNRVVVNKGTKDEQSFIEYSVEGKDHAGNAAVQHPLGSEIWAYAPNNLLTHLQWLKDPEYGKNTHVYFIDGKPRIFDAKIFPDDADHPQGWGTVLVIGMNIGGGSMEVDRNGDGKSDFTRSAYIVFDITNPEVEPKLLGEIPLPDASFTTVYPAVVSFQDIGNKKSCGEGGIPTACSQWYLLFGNGPTDLHTYKSNQNAIVYMFDLRQLRTQTAVTAPASVPANCQVKPLYTGVTDSYTVLACDTQRANSFIGAPSVVDWDLNFMSDSSYIGVIGTDPDKKTASLDSGAVVKLDFANASAISAWGLSTFFNAGLPVTAQPMVGVDNLDNKWVYFGTGRYFSMGDKSTVDQHYLYGIKDLKGAVLPVPATSLVDVSDVDVYTDGNLTEAVTGVSGSLTTHRGLVDDIDRGGASGWMRSLPNIIGEDGDPTTRNLTRSALIGGVLFTTVFQPSPDPCEGEGRSRLYGLDYKTGTGNPRTPVFGTTIVKRVDGSVSYISKPYIDLGTGMATAPAVHSGQKAGNDSLKVFTQLSTGEIVETEATPINKVRSGRLSWEEEGR